MLYAFLAYHEEDVIQAMSEADDAALMEKLNDVNAQLVRDGVMGPAARLGATDNAFTVRRDGLVTDGPFAETKEQVLGFYVLDCASREQAVEAAVALKAANPHAIYEVRPIVLYRPGMAIPFTDAGLDMVR